MREMAGWWMIAMTLQGCVVYAKDRGSCDPDDGDTGEPVHGPGDPADPETAVEPESFALAFTPARGEAGATVLASLVVVDGSFDLANIAEVTFAGAVTVDDQVTRTDEILLVLDIAPDAPPGAVDVFAVGAAGEAWILPSFEITAAAAGCPPAGTDDEGAPDDTGCP